MGIGEPVPWKDSISVDFTAVDGLGAITVMVLVSEVDLDRTRFPTIKHFTSWLGLCPGSRVTGSKVKNSKTKKFTFICLLTTKLC